MVVSLPSSLTGVVRRREVSDYFHQKAANSKHSGRGGGGRGRYFEESTAGEHQPLSNLFREGQVRKTKPTTSDVSDVSRNTTLPSKSHRAEPTSWDEIVR